MRSIRLNFTHPVAQSLTGEVTPAMVETLGQEQRFSLFVRPNFAPRDPGFDELLLVAPADMTLGFDGLYAGAGEVLAGRDMAGLAIAEVEVVATAGDSLRLAFPPISPESGWRCCGWTSPRHFLRPARCCRRRCKTAARRSGTGSGSIRATQ